MPTDVVHFACIMVADVILSGVIAAPIAVAIVRGIDRIRGRR